MKPSSLAFHLPAVVAPVTPTALTARGRFPSYIFFLAFLLVTVCAPSVLASSLAFSSATGLSSSAIFASTADAAPVATQVQSRGPLYYLRTSLVAPRADTDSDDDTGTDVEEDDGFPTWIIGVILSFSACCLSNTGVNMQKLAHNRKKRLPHHNVVKDPRWIIGMASVIVGSVLDLVSYGFASMSLLAPLGATTLIVNLFVAPCMLGEQLTRYDIIVTLIILSGTVLSVAFGSKADASFTAAELKHLYTYTLFIVYISITIALVIPALVFLIVIYKRSKKPTSNAFMPSRHGDSPVDSASMGPEPSSTPVIKKTYIVTDGQRRIEAFLYPCMAGVCGAHSVLFAKSSTAMVLESISSGDNQFDQPLPYFFIVFLGFLLVMQMKFLNNGLARADALYVVPIYQVCWVVMNAVVGMTYFRDFAEMTTLSAVMFAIGILITSIGVGLLSRRESTAVPELDLVTLTAQDTESILRRPEVKPGVCIDPETGVVTVDHTCELEVRALLVQQLEARLNLTEYGQIVAAEVAKAEAKAAAAKEKRKQARKLKKQRKQQQRGAGAGSSATDHESPAANDGSPITDKATARRDSAGNNSAITGVLKRFSFGDAGDEDNLDSIAPGEVKVNKDKDGEAIEMTTLGASRKLEKRTSASSKRGYSQPDDDHETDENTDGEDPAMLRGVSVVTTAVSAAQEKAFDWPNPGFITLHLLQTNHAQYRSSGSSSSARATGDHLNDSMTALVPNPDMAGDFLTYVRVLHCNKTACYGCCLEILRTALLERLQDDAVDRYRAAQRKLRRVLGKSLPEDEDAEAAALEKAAARVLRLSQGEDEYAVSGYLVGDSSDPYKATSYSDDLEGDDSLGGRVASLPNMKAHHKGDAAAAGAATDDNAIVFGRPKLQKRHSMYVKGSETKTDNAADAAAGAAAAGRKDSTGTASGDVSGVLSPEPVAGTGALASVAPVLALQQLESSSFAASDSTPSHPGHVAAAATAAPAAATATAPAAGGGASSQLSASASCIAPGSAGAGGLEVQQPVMGRARTSSVVVGIVPIHNFSNVAIGVNATAAATDGAATGPVMFHSDTYPDDAAAAGNASALAARGSNNNSKNASPNVSPAFLPLSGGGAAGATGGLKFTVPPLSVQGPGASVMAKAASRLGLGMGGPLSTTNASALAAAGANENATSSVAVGVIGGAGTNQTTTAATATTQQQLQLQQQLQQLQHQQQMSPLTASRARSSSYVVGFHAAEFSLSPSPSVNTLALATAGNGVNPVGTLSLSGLGLNGNNSNNSNTNNGRSMGVGVLGSPRATTVGAWLGSSNGAGDEDDEDYMDSDEDEDNEESRMNNNGDGDDVSGVAAATAAAPTPIVATATAPTTASADADANADVSASASPVSNSHSTKSKSKTHNKKHHKHNNNDSADNNNATAANTSAANAKRLQPMVEEEEDHNADLA